MIIKPLIVLSVVLNMIGFNLFAGQSDQKIADYYARENYSSVSASNSSFEFPQFPDNPLINSNSPKVNILAKNYALIDGDTGLILNSKNSDTQVPIASTTKIMTAVIALENYKLDDIVAIPEKSTTQIPTVVNLRKGEQISVSELLRCLLIKSGNDSAYALGSFMDNPAKSNFNRFVEKMNDKARELEMNNTQYQDPAGLNDSGYSSASDLGIITRYALKNSIFREIVSTPKYVASNTTKTIFHPLENSNRLITTYQYPGAIGIKTGFTDAASHSLVGAATRNSHTLIAVILGTYADTPSASADEARKLLDWGFANVTWPN